MLPIGSRPDHSCSSYKVPQLNSDERSSDDRVAPLAADPSIQTPHFSIRDYALTLRGKDIGSNWPFHQQYLQLCLKNGVKDLLPPFEPPHVVRAGSRTKRKRSGQLNACIDKETPLKVNHIQEEPLSSFNSVSGEVCHESHPLSGLSVVENSGQTHRSLPSKNKFKANDKGLSFTNQNELRPGEDETESTVCVAQSQQPCDQSKLVKVPHLPEKIENIQKLSQKKCRLVVKLGAAPDPQRTSEISSNSIMFSDSMTSKVCPVCKTFSSTSNTTLNAHIDQCLSVESNSKRVLVKPLKHKLKPSKKRLMVDIYATAACCTLEDLDRRNGTSWVSDLSLVSQSNAVCNEVKRPKGWSVGPADDENEGAVYIDSNGTKLCILSKLGSTPLDAVQESSRAKALEKKDKETRKFFVGKKRHLAANLPKNMKLKQQSKKPNSKRLLMHQIKVAPEGNTLVSQEKEESLPQKSSVLDEHRKRISTLRPKIRSLRSSKSRGENSDIVLQNPVPETMLKESVSRNYSAMEISPANLTAPPLGCSPPKTKSMNFLSSTVPERSQKESNNLKLKLPKSLGGYSSSLRSKRVECRKIVRRSCEVQKAENVPCLVQRSKPCHAVLPEDSKFFAGSNSLWTKSSLPSSDADCDARKAHFSSKKFQKCRSSLRKSCKESSAGVSVGPQVGSYQDCTINRSSCCLDIMDGDVNTSVNMSSGESDCGIAVKDVSLDLSKLEGECNGGTDGKGDESIEGQADVCSAERSPLDNTAADHSNTNMVEDQMVSYDANIHEPSTLEENEKLIGGTEAWVELFAPRSSANQQMHCGDESGNAVVTPNIEMASQLDFSEKGEEPCSKAQCIECQQAKDAAAVGKASNAHLTSPTAGHLEIHQDHSCVTSNRTFTNDDHNRESSGSPVSAASAISHPTKGDVKDAEPQASTKPAASECHKLYDSPVNSRHLELVNIESQVPDPEADAVAHDPVKAWDKYSYHCLLGESGPHELLLSSKGNMEGLMVVPPTSTFNSKPIQPPPLCSLHPNVGFETGSVGSISPGSALDGAVRYPTCRDLGSSGPSPLPQFQGSAKLVLRLMGKNVMIVDKEENMSLQEDPPCPSENLLNAQHPDVLHHSVGSHQLQHPQLVVRSRMMECDPVNLCHVSPTLPAGMQMNPFLGTTLQNGTKIDGGVHTHHQMGSCKASDLPLAFGAENMAIRRRNQELASTTCVPSHPREAIVIDGSPDMGTCPRGSSPNTGRSLSSAFSCTNHDIPLIPIGGCVPWRATYHHRRELHYGAKHGIPVSCPGTHAHANIKRGNLSDATTPLLPNQFVVPPPQNRHLTTHFYSPSLQQWRR